MHPGRIVGGRYRLQRRLASGGMGTVWEATHQTLDVPVAVKFIIDDSSSDPALLARFEREARAAARLQSPHVVRTYDYGVDDGTPYMAMELLQGEPLEARLERLGRLPSSEVTSMARQVAKGLHEAHALGIVHRDLKPANIFFARTGGDEVIKILDFGIARDESSPAADDRTGTGTLIGSPRHMSPEQARGSRVDWRSDLWSFGVVLFRCLTGERPFDGPNVGAVLASVFSDPIPAPSALSPDLAAEVDVFFERALARNPDLRFQSASDMAEALARALGPASAVSDASSEVVAREPPVRPRTEDTRVFAPQRIPDSDVTNAASTVVLSGGGASDAAAPRERASTPRRFVSLAIVVAVGASVALLAWHKIGGGVPDDARPAAASSAHLPDSTVRTAAGATEPPEVGAPDVSAPHGASSSAAPVAPHAATPRAARPRSVAPRSTAPRPTASQAPLPPPTTASQSDPFFD